MINSTKEPPLADSDIPTGHFITHSAEETFELARRIGERATGGEVFLLHGDLGAGKTVFAKGIGAGLAIDPVDVTSPTFTLVNVYEGRLRFITSICIGLRPAPIRAWVSKKYSKMRNRLQ